MGNFLLESKHFFGRVVRTFCFFFPRCREAFVFGTNSDQFCYGTVNFRFFEMFFTFLSNQLYLTSECFHERSVTACFSLDLLSSGLAFIAFSCFLQRKSNYIMCYSNWISNRLRRPFLRLLEVALLNFVSR